jgi:hypothetical protein
MHEDERSAQQLALRLTPRAPQPSRRQQHNPTSHKLVFGLRLLARLTILALPLLAHRQIVQRSLDQAANRGAMVRLATDQPLVKRTNDRARQCIVTQVVSDWAASS